MLLFIIQNVSTNILERFYIIITLKREPKFIITLTENGLKKYSYRNKFLYETTQLNDNYRNALCFELKDAQLSFLLPNLQQGHFCKNKCSTSVCSLDAQENILLRAVTQISNHAEKISQLPPIKPLLLSSIFYKVLKYFVKNVSECIQIHHKAETQDKNSWQDFWHPM